MSPNLDYLLNLDWRHGILSDEQLLGKDSATDECKHNIYRIPWLQRVVRTLLHHLRTRLRTANKPTDPIKTTFCSTR